MENLDVPVLRSLRDWRRAGSFDPTGESLEPLRGPVGIFSGSKIPPEIAVSIMAGVVAARNAIKLPRNISVGAAKASMQAPNA